jgi:hypothetical protein
MQGTAELNRKHIGDKVRLIFKLPADQRAAPDRNAAQRAFRAAAHALVSLRLGRPHAALDWLRQLIDSSRHRDA